MREQLQDLSDFVGTEQGVVWIATRVAVRVAGGAEAADEVESIGTRLCAQLFHGARHAVRRSMQILMPSLSKQLVRADGQVHRRWLLRVRAEEQARDHGPYHAASVTDSRHRDRAPAAHAGLAPRAWTCLAMSKALGRLLSGGRKCDTLYIPG